MKGKGTIKAIYGMRQAFKYVRGWMFLREEDRLRTLHAEDSTVGERRTRIWDTYTDEKVIIKDNTWGGVITNKRSGIQVCDEDAKEKKYNEG